MPPPSEFHALFAMAKIRRIGHDHHAHFQVVLVVVTNQAVTRGENKLPHEYYTLDPQIFTDSEPPIKLLIGGLIRGAPDPPLPPKYFFGGL